LTPAITSEESAELRRLRGENAELRRANENPAELTAWPREESAVADALWTADMTTRPHGEKRAYDERLAEILHAVARNAPSPLCPQDTRHMLAFGGRTCSQMQPRVALARTHPAQVSS
jgi:hypothetical protein